MAILPTSEQRLCYLFLSEGVLETFWGVGYGIESITTYTAQWPDRRAQTT